MLVKLMSGDDLPDGDYRKTYRLIADAAEVNFTHDPLRVKVPKDAEHPDGFLNFEGPYAHIKRADGATETYWLQGNAYILDEYGKTIDRFIVDPIRPLQPA